MKNFKKIIILSIIVVSTIMYLIFNYTNDNEEDIEEDIYVEIQDNIEQENKIILHMTGEVNKPRNYTST